MGFWGFGVLGEPHRQGPGLGQGVRKGALGRAASLGDRRSHFVTARLGDRLDDHRDAAGGIGRR